jgi:hypothetical protein
MMDGGVMPRLWLKTRRSSVPRYEVESPSDHCRITAGNGEIAHGRVPSSWAVMERYKYQYSHTWSIHSRTCQDEPIMSRKTLTPMDLRLLYSTSTCAILKNHSRRIIPQVAPHVDLAAREVTVLHYGPAGARPCT